jgi:hypothetical protein
VRTTVAAGEVGQTMIALTLYGNRGADGAGLAGSR